MNEPSSIQAERRESNPENADHNSKETEELISPYREPVTKLAEENKSDNIDSDEEG